MTTKKKTTAKKPANKKLENITISPEIDTTPPTFLSFAWLKERLKYAFQQGVWRQIYFAVSFAACVFGHFHPAQGIEIAFLIAAFGFGFKFVEDKALEYAKLQADAKLAAQSKLGIDL